MDDKPDEQPVAYDAEGRPLYYRPDPDNAEPETPTSASDQPQTVAPPPSTDLQQKHLDSVEQYPDLNLAPSEYVVIDVERSIFGLILIWLAVCIAFLVLAMATAMTSQIMGGSDYAMMISLSLSIICFFGGWIATYIYNHNYLIVTNFRVMSQIQNSPFSKTSQTIEMEHIEDCSYAQNGLVQTLVGYGAIRLSTVGDEQTYHFNFVRNPQAQISIINQVVHSVDEGDATSYKP